MLVILLLVLGGVVGRSLLQEGEARLTQRGCKCQKSWTINGVTINGCGNPDNSQGDWCVVDPDTCTLGKAGVLVEKGSFQGRYFDYCIEEQQVADCTEKSKNGCDCLAQWPYKTQVMSGCQNPDNDPRGPWCFVDDESCSSKPAGPVRNEAGEELGIFDYCTQGCDAKPASPEAPEIIVNVRVGAPPNFDVCKESKSGCECQGQWTYDGDGDGTIRAYYGCARTVSDTVGPWCPIVDADACTKGQPHTVAQGAVTADPWDYCQPTCAPPTTGSCTKSVMGCSCKSNWEYDGMKQSGCTRPDADSVAAWCIVDENTCSEGQARGLLPDTDLWWDVCSEEC
eukprot:TRINITY_DN47809_c0_g1_i2.p1 TRINITY_DN47809_c0_g1~~TRINITY_DN47809_c0_g1_i2.p1  ORF type:complete len:396 (-),score=52.74 TRINITY_DN47809_c0_g1_i2:409-1425(-)